MDRKRYDMDSVSIEKKLQMIQKIRQEHQMNQNAVRGREAVLYGNKYNIFPETERSENGSEGIYVSTFRLRISAALLLFILFYSVASGDKTFFGINASQVYMAIETDYSANLFDFMEEIPYTLHE